MYIYIYTYTYVYMCVTSPTVQAHKHPKQIPWVYAPICIARASYGYVDVRAMSVSFT